jgi:hypothetical protein
MNEEEENNSLSVWIEELLKIYDRQQEDLLEQNKNLKNYIKELKSQIGPLEGFTEQKQKLVYDFLKSTVDPTGTYDNATLKEILKKTEIVLLE